MTELTPSQAQAIENAINLVFDKTGFGYVVLEIHRYKIKSIFAAPSFQLPPKADVSQESKDDME